MPEKRLDSWEPTVTPDRLTTERSEREDALSHADHLAERAATTRVIGQLSLDNARLTRERDALLADVARLRGHLNIQQTYVECFACRGGVRHSYAVPVDRDGYTVLCPECAAERIWELEDRAERLRLDLWVTQQAFRDYQNRYEPRLSAEEATP